MPADPQIPAVTESSVPWRETVRRRQAAAIDAGREDRSLDTEAAAADAVDQAERERLDELEAVARAEAARRSAQSGGYPGTGARAV